MVALVVTAVILLLYTRWSQNKQRFMNCSFQEVARKLCAMPIVYSQGAAHKRDQTVAKQRVRDNGTRPVNQLKAPAQATRFNSRCCIMLRALQLRVRHGKRARPLRSRLVFACASGCRIVGVVLGPASSHRHQNWSMGDQGYA